MKNFLHWLNWFSREKITFFVGSLFLALGAIFPWYQLPPQGLETFGTNLWLANLGKILAALFAIMGFAYILLLSPSRVPRLPLWSGLIAVLLFPYFITTWSPVVTFLAASYYNQDANVDLHVETNFTQIQGQWKSNVSLVQSSQPPSIFDFSIQDSRFFQITSWDRFLIEGLGYSNNFFGLIGRGWLLTLIGFVISLLAIYVGLAEFAFNIFFRDISKLFPYTSLLLGILVLSLLLPNFVNHQIDTWFATGNYHQVIATSKTLEFWYPPVKGDQEFLKRMAEAAYYGNEPESDLIFFAKGLERYCLGDFSKAEDYFQKSLNIQPKRFLVRGYLASSLLNKGINYLNAPQNRKPAAATEAFEMALSIFPNHIEALYDLMLARVINNEFEKSVLAVQQIIDTEKNFQKPNLALLGQAYLHLAWTSYHNSDTTRTWQEYRQSVDSNTWGKSIKEEAQP